MINVTTIYHSTKKMKSIHKFICSKKVSDTKKLKSKLTLILFEKKTIFTKFGFFQKMTTFSFF